MSKGYTERLSRPCTSTLDLSTSARLGRRAPPPTLPLHLYLPPGSAVPLPARLTRAARKLLLGGLAGVELTWR